MIIMDSVDIKIIAALQGNLPLTENPYRTLAEGIGTSEAEVVRRLVRLHQAGKLKRIAAILRHQQSGYEANAMVVFQVPEATVQAVGEQLAQSTLVSHSYERKAYVQWPYNLYAMLHSRTKGELEAFVQTFAGAHNIDRFEILFSDKELKKTSMVYFV